MKKKTFRWMLVITFALIIFLFSSQIGNESEKNNKLIIYIFKVLGLNLNSLLGDLSNFIIRKVAHATEYFILYILIYRALICDIYIRSGLLLSFLFTFLYACTDEFHQLFVPGRAGLFKDVLIDSMGALVGFLLIMMITYIKHFSKDKNIN